MITILWIIGAIVALYIILQFADALIALAVIGFGVFATFHWIIPWIHSFK